MAGLCLLPASLLFSTLLASGLYDDAARAQAAAAAASTPPPAPGAAATPAAAAPTQLYCVGPTCFRRFFLIMASVALIEAAIAAAHWRHMGRFYVRLAAKRAAEKNA